MHNKYFMRKIFLYLLHYNGHNFCQNDGAMHHKLVQALPHKDLKRKVTANFGKMKNEYKLKGYVRSKINLTNQSHSLFASIYVVDENQIAAVDCVNKRLLELKWYSWFCIYQITYIVWNEKVELRTLKISLSRLCWIPSQFTQMEPITVYHSIPFLTVTKESLKVAAVVTWLFH